MIAIDTNVLLRYLLQDDNTQSSKANKLIRGKIKILVTEHKIRNTKPIKVGSKKKDADFANALVLEKAKYDCDRKDSVFEGLYSFDEAAQQIEGKTL